MNFSTLLPSLSNTDNILSGLGHSFLNLNSLFILIISLIIGIVVANFAAQLVQKLSLFFGRRADKSTNIAKVTFLRRIETFLVLSVALIRLIIVLISLYVWWVLTHAGQQPSALIGASALALVIAYGLSGPLLRDIAFGSGMMAEQWFGVGDIVNIQPNDKIGIVEKVTLRSTRIRSFSGETIWFSNQNINMVSVIRKGTWTIALEIFVSSTKIAEELIEQTNYLLPKGTSLLISPIVVASVEEETPGIWHITAVGETAPGRDSLIRKNAVDILNKLDNKLKEPVILAEIVSRFADKKTDKQLDRAISNARKSPRIKKKYFRT